MERRVIFRMQQADIDFMTTPYDLDAITQMDQLLPAYKIGSGIFEIIITISKMKTSISCYWISNVNEVIEAVGIILENNSRFVLCNAILITLVT